jgi:dihydroorotase
VTTPSVDIFDRERVFVETTLPGVISEYPELPLVLEHITTLEAAQSVAEGPPTLAATITPQHLLVNRNAMLAGGIRPHLYCLPILKREEDRIALVKAATSGSPKYFLGTDSAPHAVEAKETACGCAGCFTASHALELYAEAFDDAEGLDRLEGFASHHGPDFYGLPRNHGTVTLVEESAKIPESLLLRGSTVRPFRAGGQTRWRLA